MRGRRAEEEKPGEETHPPLSLGRGSFLPEVAAAMSTIEVEGRDIRDSKLGFVNSRQSYCWCLQTDLSYLKRKSSDMGRKKVDRWLKLFSF